MKKFQFEEYRIILSKIVIQATEWSFSSKLCKNIIYNSFLNFFQRLDDRDSWKIFYFVNIQITKIKNLILSIYIYPVCVRTIHLFESTSFERKTVRRYKGLFVIFREEGTRGKGKSTRDLLPGAIGKIWRGFGENGIRGRLPYRVINIFWSRSCFDV